MRGRRVVRVVGWLVGGLAALVLALYLGGFALPEQTQWVDTSADLQAPAEELFPLFNSREGMQKMWTRASERAGADATAPMHLADLGGPDAGVGTRIGFYPADGEASWSAMPGDGEILDSIAERKVVLVIDFDLVTAHRSVTLEPLSEHTTRVRWVETLEARNALMRYALLLNDASVAEGFAQVLLAAEDVASR